MVSLFRHEDEHGVPGSLEYQSPTAGMMMSTRVAVDHDRAIGTNSNSSPGLSVVNHVLDYEDEIAVMIHHGDDYSLISKVNSQQGSHLLTLAAPLVEVKSTAPSLANRSEITAFPPGLMAGKSSSRAHLELFL